VQIECETNVHIELRVE